MAIQESGEARTAAMRSTSNRLLRIKQASASSILEGVSTACSIGSAGERGREREGERERIGEAMKHRKEGVVMLLSERIKEEKSGTIEQQMYQSVFQAHAI